MASVYAALAAVMGDVQAVRKEQRNQQQGFMFRGIDKVMSAVGPAFRAHGIVVGSHVESSVYEQVEVGAKRTPMGHARVTVTYRFYGPEGDFVEASAPGEAMDSGDKATAKAMSVAYRTALLQALCLPTDEADPDGETYVRSEHRAQPEPQHESPDWSDANVVRRYFGAWIKENGLDLKEADERYHRATGKQIGTTTDAAGLLAVWRAWEDDLREASNAQ